MVKPIGLGAAVGFLIFLAMRGVDIWPLVFVLAIAGALISTGMLSRLNLGQARRTEGRIPNVEFSDIGGQTTAKAELKEALEVLRHPEAFEVLGIRPLQGILLTGPPGTGKTLLAKAAARYTDSTFLSASGSEFVEMYAGVGAQRVRQLFQEARSAAKRDGRGSAIIFVDEIEVMAGKRGQHHSHLEYDQTLNQLLVEMDGIATHAEVQVLVMAATNRADLLDQALLRPGRFDRLVRVDLPDREGRLHILHLHTQNKPLHADVDLDVIARETFGFSGAHLESVCNEAAILALRDKETKIGMHHLKSSVDKVMLGEKLDRHLRKEEMIRVATHEGGHALISEWLHPGSVSSVTITPRGMALGFMRQSPEDDRLLETVAELRADIAVCLAGSAAERIILGQASTGAANDFEKAWEIARRMVFSGLSTLGIVQEEAISSELLYQTVTALMAEETDRVDEFIRTHRSWFESLAKALLEQETLDGSEVRRWLETFNGGMHSA
ncbi:MAG: AAA family ATPase [Firmicutes bacterium]|nr:AAA family ATPase [Bacillota bacterium]MCL5065732.1 AAA family ATPase [Bacillota bacterium]